MRTLHSRQTLLSISICSLLLAFILVACGSTSTGTGGSPGSTPTPTSVKGYGTAYGCPDDSVVSNTTTANVTVNPRDTNSAIMAHNGDIIEFQFPFGQRWSGPTTSQGHLELLQPAGYAVRASKVCAWRFVAKGTGETHLDFHAQALCKLGQVCPQYIVDMSFTVDVR